MFMLINQSCNIAYQNTETCRAISFIIILNNQKLEYIRCCNASLLLETFSPSILIYVTSEDFFNFLQLTCTFSLYICAI